MSAVHLVADNTPRPLTREERITQMLEFYEQPSTVLIQYTDTYDRDALDKVHNAYIKHKKIWNINGDIIAPHPIDNSQEGGAAACELVNSSQRPVRIIAGINYAPAEKKSGTKRNARKDFYSAILRPEDDAGFVVTMNGYELSYIKSRIQFFGRYTRTNEIGSQFRSCEFMPEHANRQAWSEQVETMLRSGELEAQDNLDAIPDVPDVTHVYQEDNFQNEKLYLSEADRKALTRIAEYNRERPVTDKLSIKLAFGKASIEFEPDQKPGQAKIHTAIVSDYLFDAGFGKNVLAMNSSSTIHEVSASTIFGKTVPILAKIRPRPSETPSGFGRRKVGQPVFIQFPHIPA